MVNGITLWFCSPDSGAQRHLPLPPRPAKRQYLFNVYILKQGLEYIMGHKKVCVFLSMRWCATARRTSPLRAWSAPFQNFYQVMVCCHATSVDNRMGENIFDGRVVFVVKQLRDLHLIREGNLRRVVST